MKTLGEVEAYLADHLDRSDLETRIPEFITMAEDDIYTRLRTSDNAFVETIVIDLEADPQVAPISPITLPNNFLEMRMVLVDGVPVEAMSDIELYKYQTNTGNAQGAPIYYTLVERELLLTPWPTEVPTDTWEGTLEIHYYGSETLYQMSGWNTPTNPVDTPPQEPGTTSYDGQGPTNTTRLLQRHPTLYLFGPLFYAYEFLQNDAQAKKWSQRFYAQLDTLQARDRRSRQSGSTKSVRSAY